VILALFAATGAIACVAASARRLGFAIAPTPFDHRTLREAVDKSGSKKLSAAIAREPAAMWEQELFVAIESPEEERAARMNEALAEIDFRLGRWSRVPRVCASIASSAGLLCGAIALRSGLEDVSHAPDGAIDAVLNRAVSNSLGVAALGIAAAVICVAIDSEARRAVKSRRLAADLLVERLERAEPRAGVQEPKKAEMALEVV
jgi:biopolymer transport protein ExbB/TolQ